MREIKRESVDDEFELKTDQSSDSEKTSAFGSPHSSSNEIIIISDSSDEEDNDEKLGQDME